MRLFILVEGLVPLVLIAAGVGLVLFGVLQGAGGRLGLGRLPGDVRAQRGPVTFFAPMGTSLLLSVILTVVLNLAFCAGPR